MTKPIILWHSERILSTDDAGVTISFTGPPMAYFEPGPYDDEDRAPNRFPESLPRIPPLPYFCIKRLIETPELVYHYGSPRPYRPPLVPGDPDILHALIPRSRRDPFDLSRVDPRLWAIILQVYSDLPHNLRTYRTALCDKYTPLLQHIPATEHFSLITVLELPGCSHLNDDTIVHLKILQTLCVLDASHSNISALGIRRLSGTLMWIDDDVEGDRWRGPRQLRILSLYNCKRVTNAVYQCLEAFILLTAVGKVTQSIKFSDFVMLFRSPRHKLHLGPRENTFVILSGSREAAVPSHESTRSILTVVRFPRSLSLQ
ncbi:hypothetical protein F5148DRAFT_1346901 [Russula earlei]|uniref:Uncharacterized protein n=1 Tax=Russula earlei TaxID=71964 RepID=A0ACC0UEV8_9AGAM|nr:hypothetical protein F5148DRAFT_1346901 [Russula earlei]